MDIILFICLMLFPSVIAMLGWFAGTIQSRK